MRHETVITQKGFLDILRKFHSVSKSKDDELVIELTNKDILSKIELPELLDQLCEQYDISNEDIINFILKSFCIEWKLGKSTFQNILLNKFNLKDIESFNKFKKSTNLKDFVEKMKEGDI